MAAYDGVLAQQILLALQEVFPNKVSSHELKARHPFFVEIPENQWMVALDALLGLRLIDGKTLRAGPHSTLEAAANLEITPQGRESLSPPVVRGASVTQNFHQHGPNSRINVNSTDNSVNVASVSNDKLFVQMREATESISDESERAKILSRLDDLESSRGSSKFLPAYQSFISSVADYMTIFGPFIPSLTNMHS
jgi:hypothetical protein